MKDTRKLSRRSFVAAGAMLAVAAPFALAGCAGSGSGGKDEAEDKKDEPQTEPTDDATAQDDTADAAAGEYTLLTEGTLTVATSPDYPPFENLEGDEYVGLDIDLIKAIAEKMGLTVEFKSLQFDAIIPAIAAGGQADCAISAFSVDPERAKEIDFTDSYYIDDLAIVAMKDGDITAENVDTELNNAQRTIAAQSGTTGESYAKENYPDATVKGYGNATDCFAALQAGQVDAVCTNNAVAKKTIEESYTDAQIVKEIATGEEYSIVVSKDNPGLTAAINAAIAELFEEGVVDELSAKHLG